MKEAVSEDTVFVDPAEELVRRIRRWELPIGGADRIFTSGDPQKMKSAALNAFGVEFEKITRITICERPSRFSQTRKNLMPPKPAGCIRVVRSGWAGPQ
jgi:hypothetical protein